MIIYILPGKRQNCFNRFAKKLKHDSQGVCYMSKSKDLENTKQLPELLNQITNVNLHQEINFGKAVGKEIIDKHFSRQKNTPAHKNLIVK